MRSTLTRSGLGGGLLSDVLQRMGAAAEQARKGSKVRAAHAGCAHGSGWAGVRKGALASHICLCAYHSMCGLRFSGRLFSQHCTTNPHPGPPDSTLSPASNPSILRPQVHFYRLMLASAHYNTQLAVLAALQLDKRLTPAQLPWLDVLPATSSLLAFELHSGPAVQAVRLVIQDGPAKPYRTVPLPQCAQPGSAAEALAGPGACELDTFLNMAQGAALPTAAAWCDECANAAIDACIAARFAGAAAPPPAAAASGQTWRIAVAAIASSAGTAALVAAGAIIFTRCAGARRPEEAGAAQQLGVIKAPRLELGAEL
jgi:hypothetical protein